MESNKTSKKLSLKQTTCFTVVKVSFFICFILYSSSNVLYTQSNNTKNAQQKEQILLQLENQTTTFLSTVNEKRVKLQQQKEELEKELTILQSKKKRKKTQAEDEQRKEAILKKLASLETKDKEYQRMENEAMELLATLKNTYPANKNLAPNTIEKEQSTLQEPIQKNNVTNSENNTVKTQQYQPAVANRSTPTVDYSKKNVVKTQQPQTSVASGNVANGYYIVFGSFVERNNAERFLTRLKSQFSNVVDIGNDNIFGMYRTGIGPFKTKEEAIAKRPTDMKNWVLKVETIPNTRLVAYYQITDK